MGDQSLFGNNLGKLKDMYKRISLVCILPSDKSYLKITLRMSLTNCLSKINITAIFTANSNLIKLYLVMF